MKKAIVPIAVLIACFSIAMQFIQTDWKPVLDLSLGVFSIAVHVWLAGRVFVRAVRLGDKGVMYIGAFGLAILAVSAIYRFAYSFIGTEPGLNISNFTDACSYLFFITAISLLLSPPPRLEKRVRALVNVAAAATIVIAAYSILTNNNLLLQINIIPTSLICVILSGWLLVQAGKTEDLKRAKLFAASMLSQYVLNILVCTALLTGAGDFLLLIITPLYLPITILMAQGLLRLREESGSNG